MGPIIGKNGTGYFPLAPFRRCGSHISKYSECNVLKELDDLLSINLEFDFYAPSQH